MCGLIKRGTECLGFFPSEIRSWSNGSIIFNVLVEYAGKVKLVRGRVNYSSRNNLKLLVGRKRRLERKRRIKKPSEKYNSTFRSTRVKDQFESVLCSPITNLTTWEYVIPSIVFASERKKKKRRERQSSIGAPSRGDKRRIESKMWDNSKDISGSLVRATLRDHSRWLPII